MRLVNKVAIVTGAGRGIGKAIALALAKEGADLVVVSRTPSEFMETAKEVEVLGRQALTLKVDVSKKEDVDSMVNLTMQKFGKIDVLVNNAGASMVRPSEELSEEDWDKTIAVNLKGVFLCSQAVGRIMIKQKMGKIINISSMAGKIGLPMRAAYCAAKAGVIALTKVLAVEWAKYSININAIAPSIVKTSIIADLIRRGLANEEDLIRRTPMRRLATPEEVADLAVFLVSDASKYITGQTIFIDGGWLATSWPHFGKWHR